MLRLWSKARKIQSTQIEGSSTMATTTTSCAARKGCAFLLEEILPQEIFTRERLSEEHSPLSERWKSSAAMKLSPNCLPSARRSLASPWKF